MVVFILEDHPKNSANTTCLARQGALAALSELNAARETVAVWSEPFTRGVDDTRLLHTQNWANSFKIGKVSYLEYGSSYSKVRILREWMQPLENKRK